MTIIINSRPPVPIQPRSSYSQSVVLQHKMGPIHSPTATAAAAAIVSNFPLPPFQTLLISGQTAATSLMMSSSFPSRKKGPPMFRPERVFRTGSKSKGRAAAGRVQRRMDDDAGREKTTNTDEHERWKKEEEEEEEEEEGEEEEGRTRKEEKEDGGRKGKGPAD
uniref:Uncharacterized protein n=1 Tax=Globodera rostochiensis TaxID=31243 RepID=A0A914I681_GLORO